MKRKSLHEGNRFTATEVLPRGWQDLCNAIVTQAAQDYIKAVKYRLDKGKDGTKQLEKFFRSKWYKDLTDIDGEWLMGRLREAVDAGRQVKHADPTVAGVGHGDGKGGRVKRKRKHKPGTLGGYEKVPLIEKMVRVGRRSV